MRALTWNSKHERSGHSRSLSFPSVCLWQRNELNTSHRGEQKILKKQLNQERDKEDKEWPSEEEDSNKKRRMPTCDIKECCTAGKSFSLWLQSGFPTKLKWTDFVSWLKISVWITFKNILKKKEREVQSTLGRFLTSPLAKRQRPATEEEKTYLE